MSYITQKFEDLIKGPNPKATSHLDLETMANVGLPPAPKKTLEKTYVTNRSDWIYQIVWRAVTIHDDLLWKKTETELETEALDELLDRRLHAVEQLYCNVNSGGIQISTLGRKWKVSGPGSGEATTAAAAAVLSTESHIVAATGAVWRGGQQCVAAHGQS